MSNYVKPAIKLATNADGLHMPGTCDTTAADMELIQSLVGIENMETAFSMTESCINKIPFDMYCKFTSADLGGLSVFWS